MPRETKSLLNSRLVSIIVGLIFSGFISFAPFQEIPSVFAVGNEDSGIAAAALEEDDSDSDFVLAEEESVPSAGKMGRVFCFQRRSGPSVCRQVRSV